VRQAEGIAIDGLVREFGDDVWNMKAIKPARRA
jgi:hypothetical protein